MQERSPDILNFTINFGSQHPAAYGVQMVLSWTEKSWREGRPTAHGAKHLAAARAKSSA